VQLTWNGCSFGSSATAVWLTHTETQTVFDWLLLAQSAQLKIMLRTAVREIN